MCVDYQKVHKKKSFEHNFRLVNDLRVDSLKRILAGCGSDVKVLLADSICGGYTDYLLQCNESEDTSTSPGSSSELVLLREALENMTASIVSISLKVTPLKPAICVKLLHSVSGVCP